LVVIIATLPPRRWISALVPTVDLGKIDAALDSQLLQPVEDRPAGVVRRRGPLVAHDPAGCRLAGEEIGEGAASIDTDGPGHPRVP
jgi:hypothetical protein